MNESAVWTLEGDLLVDRASQLHAEALDLARGECPVLVDGQAVTSMDASALQILWALHDAVTAGGRTFQMCRPSTPMRQAFTLAGLDRWLLQIQTADQESAGESSEEAALSAPT